MEQTTQLTAAQRERLAGYADAVRASPHNLLSRRGLEELESRHIAESLLFARGLPPGPASVLDLGSGGGLPGMVVAIARPDLRVTLLDATEKKVAFLAETAESLGIDVATLHGRAEDVAGEYSGTFDMVVARAVAPLERLVPWAFPFLTPGGVLLAIKGERWEAELRVAQPVLRQLGARVVGTPSTDPPRVHGVPVPRVVSIGRPVT